MALFSKKKSNGSKKSPKEFAVIGLGRFGASVAATLVQQGHTVLGIDRDPALVQRYSHEITQTVSLDSTDEEALKEIDITSYETVVVAIGASFESNLMTTVALKSVGVRHVICKTTTQVHRDILLRVGADRVVLPEYEAGEQLAKELIAPVLVGQFDLCENWTVSEVKPPDKMVGASLEDLDWKGRFGLTVVALHRGSQVTVNPSHALIVQKGDLLVVIGSPRGLEQLAHDL